MLLAIDTSTRAGSVALLDGDRLEERALDRADHGARLAPAVAELLGPGGLSRVTAYALTIGPGSFTGLRIGLAFLKGLAAVHPRPVVPVSTLRVLAEVLAELHPRAGGALAALDARRDEVFAALFLREPGGLVAADALAEGVHPVARVRAAVEGSGLALVAGGDGLALPALAGLPLVSRPDLGPRAGTLARLGAAALAAGAGVAAGAVELAYLQASAAEEKLAGASR